MGTRRTEYHATALSARTGMLLARAQTETGLAQLWTLAVASQVLRERLDIMDCYLRTFLEEQPDEQLPSSLIESFMVVGEHLRECERCIAARPGDAAVLGDQRAEEP